MEGFELIPLCAQERAEFRYELQKAFQYGYEQVFGPCSQPVISEDDIDQSMTGDGAVSYVARIRGSLAGGAVVKIDPTGRHNDLELLFVKVGIQSRGVGQAIWKQVESLYPETEVWETFTPYFDKRNIHFYVNCCGFHIVEFFHARHPMPYEEGEYQGGMTEEAAQNFFRFMKWMRQE